MSPPQNSRSNPSLQASVAVLANEVLTLRDRAAEDRDAIWDELRSQREALDAAIEKEQTFNRATYVSKVEMKPVLALFWAVVSAIVLGVLGTGLTLLLNHPK